MAAKIGVLGESTSTGGGTIYTVPANKAAKVRLQWYVQSPGGGGTVVAISVNGLVVYRSATSASQFCYTVAAVSTPGTPTIVANSASDGISAGTHIATPTPPDFYLSTGDTVSWTLTSNTPTTAAIQVVGVEDDA